MNWTALYGQLLKIGASVGLSIVICLHLQLPPFFAVLAAVLAWDPLGRDAVQNGWSRLLSACAGAGFALLFFYTLGAHPIVYACVTVITLAFCYYASVGKFRAIASVTAIAILPTMAGAGLYEYITRVMSTLVGIILSSVLNIAFDQPTSMTPFKIRSEKYWSQGLDLLAFIIDVELKVGDVQQHPERWAQFDAMRAKLRRLMKRTEKLRPERQYLSASDQQALRLIEKRLYTLSELFEHVHKLREPKNKRRGQTDIPFVIRGFMRMPRLLPTLNEREVRQLFVWFEELMLRENNHMLACGYSIPPVHEVAGECMHTLNVSRIWEQEKEQEDDLPAPQQKTIASVSAKNTGA
ncbi:FUSC family protein [Salicibibacter halophilus]|uniref:FUSC family protein n=1 Tax=Salicibibacter halophilus TaxID=2502791 RepID=UPI00135CC4B7|nr:aromatic acid exporter family protein [Salicibibacter halophilus]